MRQPSNSTEPSSRPISTRSPNGPMRSSTGAEPTDERRVAGIACAYRLATQVATPFAGQLLRHRLRRGKEHSVRLPERRGETEVPRPDGALVWVHGASVGELIAAVPLVERIRERGLSLLVTSGTVTSAGIARQRLPPDVIHQFIPLDVPGFVTRFLDHWRPSLALFVESDLWP